MAYNKLHITGVNSRYCGNGWLTLAAEKTGEQTIKEPEKRELCMQIIPAIDIIDGKCVRLTEGDYATQKIYNENPLEVAKAFEDAGFSRVHVVDLDGAKAGKVRNWKVLEAVAGKTGMAVDFGGGIKTSADVDIVFNAGAQWATIGSLAVKDEKTFVQWLQQYGAAKFMLGADVRDEKITIGGWLETTDINILDFIGNYLQQGVQQIFCTDVSKDGKLEGPAIDLYKKILKAHPAPAIIASGGVSNIKDVADLAEAGCGGVIIGKAIYENRVSLQELQAYNN